jgi:hypothetical protein
MTQVEVPKSGNAHQWPFLSDYRIKRKKSLTYLFFAEWGIFFSPGNKA